MVSSRGKQVGDDIVRYQSDLIRHHHHYDIDKEQGITAFKREFWQKHRPPWMRRRFARRRWAQRHRLNSRTKMILGFMYQYLIILVDGGQVRNQLYSMV